MDVRGGVSPGFEAVHDAFRTHLGDLGDGGAAVAAVVRGRMVVDLWAGRAGAGPWSSCTRAVVMSATKGVAATAVACLVDEGLIDVEAPVATYWPEFAAGGKADVTVANLLSHAGGLVTVPGYEELVTPDGAGWDRTAEIIARLEGAAPAWAPGSGHAYHGVTYGWLVGELVRRASGTTVGRVVADRIARPLGLELDLGTPPERQALVAPTILPPQPPPLAEMKSTMLDPELFDRMMFTVNGRSILHTADHFFADPRILELELPAQNGTATARALALMYGALANDSADRSLLSAGTVRTFMRERIRGRDRITGIERRWGLGFQLATPESSEMWGLPAAAFGHDGFGGQVGFADPAQGVGIGFVRSHLAWAQILGPALVKTIYSCLGATTQ